MYGINSHKSSIRWRFSYLTPPEKYQAQAHTMYGLHSRLIPSFLFAVSFVLHIWSESEFYFRLLFRGLRVAMVQVAELEFCSLAELSCQALRVSSKIREWLWLTPPSLRYFIFNIKPNTFILITPGKAFTHPFYNNKREKVVLSVPLVNIYFSQSPLPPPPPLPSFRVAC